MSDAQIWYALIAGSVINFWGLLLLVSITNEKYPKPPPKVAPYNPSMRER